MKFIGGNLINSKNRNSQKKNVKLLKDLKEKFIFSDTPNNMTI
jgi:hypothetical protein